MLTVDIICKYTSFTGDPNQLKEGKNITTLNILNKIIHHILTIIIPNALKIYGIYEFQMVRLFIKELRSIQPH